VQCTSLLVRKFRHNHLFYLYTSVPCTFQYISHSPFIFLSQRGSFFRYFQVGGRFLPVCGRKCAPSATLLSGAVSPPRNAPPPRTTATTKAAKGSFAPRARKECPQASALRLCSPHCVRSFRSGLPPLQEWEIPLPLQLLPPTFARRRSAFM
jgi:hypothetical protein